MSISFFLQSFLMPNFFKKILQIKAIFQHLIVGLLCIPSMLMAQKDAKNDLFLQNLQTQLTKNFDFLAAQDNRLTFLAYHVEDEQQFCASSTFGAIDSDNFTHVKKLSITLYLGDVRTISKSSQILLPIEEDSLALAQILKYETEAAYWEALRQYDSVALHRTFYLSNLSSEVFNYSSAQKYYESPIPFQIDREQWRKKLRKYSLNFKSNPSIVKGVSSIDCKSIRSYWVSSEGGQVVQNSNYAYLDVNLLAYAEDGMPLPLSCSWFSFFEDELPDENVVLKTTMTLQEKLDLLLSAPIEVLPTAPALLSSHTTALWAQKVLFPNLLNSKLDEYKGKFLFPLPLSVQIDPILKYFKSYPMSGGYRYDAEGVLAVPFTAINRGDVQTLPTTRWGTKNSESTASARSQIGYPSSAQVSNVVISSDKTYSDDELRKLLIQEVRKQGKAYGYRIEVDEVRGEECESPYFTIMTPLVYKVFAEDAPDVLVRGVQWQGEITSTLLNIVAVGETQHAIAFRSTGPSGELPISVAAPPLLLSEITLYPQAFHSQVQLQSRPFHDYEDLTDFDEIAFKAMQEEISRTRLAFTRIGLVAPSYLAFMLTDARHFATKASLGTSIYAKESQKRAAYPIFAIGNHNWNTLNCDSENDFQEKPLLPFPLDNDYGVIRSAIWSAAEQEYRRVQRLWSQKNRNFVKDGVFNLPNSTEKTSKISSIKDINSSPAPLQAAILDNVVRELSKQFADYPQLSQSFVEAEFLDAHLLYLSSEKIQYDNPQQWVAIRAFAEVVSENGTRFSDSQRFYYRTTQNLNTFEYEKGKIIQMVENLLNLCNSKPIQEPYNGPILFVDEAVADLFVFNFLEDNDVLFARNEVVFSDQGSQIYQNPFENKTSKNSFFSKNFSLYALDYQETFEEKELIGAFFMDAEGTIPPSVTQIIKNGQIHQLLSNRLGTITSRESNGHQRIAFNGDSFYPKLAAGVLKLYERGCKLKRLHERACVEARRAGYNYYYVVEKFVENSRKPLIIYRVDTKNNKVEWVNSAEIKLPQISDYKKNILFSSSYNAFNRMIQSKNMRIQEPSLLLGTPHSFILPDAFLYIQGGVCRESKSTLSPSFIFDK